jgi:trimeric autotransporter adhesin
MTNTWGQSGTTWGQNQWGDQADVDVSITAPTQLSTTLGTVIPFNELGWGSDTWGTENWGESGLTVLISGVAATSTVGTITPSDVMGLTGLSATSSVGSIINGIGIPLTGLSATSTVGSIIVGTGVPLTGLAATSSVGAIAPADVMGLTGLSATSAFGSLSFTIDSTFTLSGQAATTTVGSIIVGVGIPLTGLALTTAVGSPVARGDYTESLTGLSALGAVGDVTVTSNPTVQPAGLSLTSALGVLTPADVMGLTGLSLTSTVGSISPEDVMGLTGLSATVSVGNVAPLGYKDITGTQSASYSNVAATQSASYSNVTATQSAGYRTLIVYNVIDFISNIIKDLIRRTKFMASTYTDLGLELMATGENAGTWGTKTNANLNLVEQITGGYLEVSIAGGVQTTELDVDDGALTGKAQNRIIKFTGTITGNQTVTLPVLMENFYIIENATTGAFTVELKAASGSGATVTWSATDKGWKIVYADGVATNTGIYDTGFSTSAGDVTLTGTQTLTNKTLTAPKIGTSILDTNGNELFLLTATASAVNEITLANATTGNKPTFTATGDDTDIGVSIQPKGTGTVTIDALTFPAADGTADQVLTTNGSGVLSFVDNTGGTAWVAVKTTGFTAVAGEGYFCDTTSAAFTMTLPVGTLGDEISFIDYAGTFDTNALTIAPNGAEKIQGTAASLTVSVERAANTLVYTDGTQGWLLKAK